MPSIAVVTFCNSATLDFAELSAAINRAYCERHGYRFIHEVYDQVALHFSHEKIHVVERALPVADYVCWLDSDACIIDFAQPLAEFCEHDADLIIGGHEFGFDLLGYRRRFRLGSLPCGLNGGVFMVRRSEWSFNFLRHWWRRCERGHRIPTSFWEQGQLQDMFMHDELGVQRHTKLIVPCSRLNRCDDNHAEVCDFILHLWGTSSAFRREVFQQIASGIKPSIGIEMPRFNVDSILNDEQG